MPWVIKVGDIAPGLGVVLDQKQICPTYGESVPFSGELGCLALVVIQPYLVTKHDGLQRSERFVIVKWLYNESEPRAIEYAYPSLDAAYSAWEDLCQEL